MSPVLPDIILLSLGALVLMAAVLNVPGSSKLSFHLSWMGLAAVSGCILWLPKDQESVVLSNYVVTGFGLLFKFVFSTSALFTVWLARVYFADSGTHRGKLKNEGEFYALIHFCTFGMFAVASSNDLVTLFVALELATIPLYALTSYFKHDRHSTEGGTKYVLMGTTSTAVLLFGYSFIYGAAGSLHFDSISQFVVENGATPLFVTGLLFILAAVGFKLAMAPFHMWAPDVYEGAPTPVTAYLSVASKAAALGFIVVVFYGPFAGARTSVMPALTAAAVLSMVVGNLGALRQSNLRRFMAYSSIAQAGYLLVGLTGNGRMAVPSIIFYLFVYGVTNFCTFFIISIIGQKRPETFESLRGLSRQSPGLAALLMLCMFSLAGIPPVAGFTGKFMLFASAAEGGHYGLVVFAALNSTVSLYYYLLVLKEAYITKPEGDLAPLEIGFLQRWALLLLGAGVLLLGVWPGLSSYIADVVAL